MKRFGSGGGERRGRWTAPIRAGAAGLVLLAAVGCDGGSGHGQTSQLTFTQLTILPARADVVTTDGGYVVLADFDNDGDLDAASGFASDQDVLLHLQDAAGVWLNSILGTGHGRIQSLAVADVDESGQPDVFAATDTGKIVLFLAPSFAGLDGAWDDSVLNNPTPVAFWSDVKVADLDNQTGEEVIAVSPSSNLIAVWRAEADVGSAADYHGFVIANLTNEFDRLELGDIDGDNDTDVVAVGPVKVVWLENPGTADITQAWTVHTVGNRGGLTRLAVADVDGDGDLDIVATSRTTGEVILFENLGDPRSDRWHSYVIADLSPEEPDALSPGDLDRDGQTDLLVGSDGPEGTIFWLTPYDNVRLSWSVQELTKTGAEVGELPRGNLDGAGGLDFATTLAGSATPVVWFRQD